MKFQAVYDELLNTGTKLRLLRAFFTYPSMEFSEREMERIAKIPQASVHRNIKPLVENGLVALRRIGRTNLYTLNGDHALHRPLAEFFQRERGLLPSLKETIKGDLRGRKEIRVAVLFGSILKGQERPDSDVDIFLFVENGAPAAYEPLLERIRVKVARRFGNPVSFYIKSTRELAQLRQMAIYPQIKAGEVLLSRRATKW